MTDNSLKNKISGLFRDSTFNSDKKNKIIEMYERFNFKVDDSGAGVVKAIDKFFDTDFVASASYLFPKASGQYKEKLIKIAPSYYPYVISDIGLEGNVDEILLKQLNPSVIVKRGTNTASYDYLVISVEMKIDIGMPSILICPNTFVNRVLGMYSMLRGITSTNYKEFDKKYLIASGKQKWFLESLNKEIMDSMIELNLPGIYGAVFQFSKNHGTFAILPGAIETEKIEKIIEIIWQIINNIERIKIENTTR